MNERATMRTRRVRQRFWAAALTGLLVAGLLGGPAAPAAAAAGFGELRWNENGDTFKHVTSANTPVTIYEGRIDFLCDFIFPTADIYVVRGVPAEGDDLVDVSSAPNTVQAASGGIFIEETIGVTVPTGTLAVGTYSIVYDECQDGIVSVLDTVFPRALRVDVPTDLPPIDPAIAALKYSATFLQAQWESRADVFAQISLIEKLKLISKCVTLGLAGCAITAALGEAMKQYTELIRLATGSADPKKAAKDAALDAASHYRGIAADPPDPAFTDLAVPIQPPPLVPETGDGLERVMIDLANQAAAEGALGAALLHAIERYQGADAVDDGTWGLIQLRDARTLAAALSAELGRSDAALDAMSGALAAAATDLDEIADLAAPELAAIAAGGFSAVQVRELRHAGLTDAKIEDLRLYVGEEPDLGGFSAAAEIAAIADHRAAGADARAALDGLVADLSTMIASIEAEPTITPGLPAADAGGPYTGSEGVAVQLDGSVSSDPDGPLAELAWDLDADGAFDDALGDAPQVTFDLAGSHLVALRATDAEGNVSMDVATVVVIDTRHPPVIDSAVPVDDQVEVTVGTGQAFSVTATDPDGDPVSIGWSLDGVAAGTGGTYAYGPVSAADIGFHQVTALASDGLPGGGSTARTWVARVLAADADGDLWRANLDCDDADAAVNPDAVEIALNGRDDDCDPSTSDDGLSPAASFVSSAPGGGRNVALIDAGPLNPTPSAASPTSVASSPVFDGTTTMNAALNIGIEDNAWLAGAAAVRYGVVRLQGSGSWLIDRVGVMPRTDHQPSRVRQFAIDVSTTGFASESDWTQVLTAEAADSGALQTFAFPGGPVPARYVRMRLLSNRGDAQFIAVEQLKIYTTQQSAGSSFTFEDRSTDPDSDIVTRLWDFGDGATSGLADPSHTYAAPGSYLVSLTVTDSRGHSSTTSLPHAVLRPPVPAFTTPATIVERNSISIPSFTATDPDGERIVRIEWTWGDGTAASLQTGASAPGHQYLQDGTYTVRMTIFDSQEQVAFTERTATVLNVAPVVSISNRTVASGVSHNYAFSVNDPADTLTCSLDFGDGSPPATGCVTQPHAYPVLAPGALNLIYTQTLSVSDDDTTVTATATITVVATMANRTVPDGLSFVYSLPAVATGPIAPLTCSWNFGDGSPAETGCTAKAHAYPVMAPGSPDAQYPLTVTLTNPGGSGSVRGIVTVRGNPVAPYFSTTFDAGAPSQFSGGTGTEPVQGYTPYGFAGKMLRSTATPSSSTVLTLTGLPEHTGVSLGFLLAIIDSWDGATSCGAGPDRFFIRIDGTTVFSNVFENSFCGIQTYVPPPNVELARHVSAGFVADGGFFSDSAYNLGFDPTFQEIPHTAGTLTIEFGSTGVGATDESWGIDNLEVFLLGVTGNAAPTADAGGPYTVDEGSAVVVVGSGSSDPDGDALTYEWDLDLDGAYDDATGASVVLTPDDGATTLTIGLRVTDPGGEADTDQATVSVANIAPTAVLSAPPSVVEGETFGISLGSAFDPSTADAAALEYAFDCGFGAGYGAFGSASSTTCTAGDDDVDAAVRATVRDNDGGAREYTASVSVVNGPPSGTFTAGSPILEGGSSTLAWSATTDPSSTDAAALRYSFACDGLISSLTGAWASASPTPTATCPFDDNGSFGVAGRVIDPDNASQTTGAGVTVENVAPSATFSAPATVAEGSTYGLALTGATDPSIADTVAGFSYAFDCGDGAGFGSFTGAPSVSCGIATADGDRPVAGIVRDKDGGTRLYSATVGVTNVAPSADATTDGPRPWGVPVGFSVGTSDPSPVDAASLAISWDLDDDGAFDDATGATASRTFSSPGTYPVRARVCDDDTCVEASTSASVTPHATALAIGGAAGGTYSDPAGVSVTLTDTTVPGAVAGVPVNLVLGTQSASGTTNGGGVAMPAIVIDQAAGAKSMSASFAGSTLYLPTSATGSYTVGQEAASVAYSGDTFATGTNARLAATVSEAADGSLGDIARASVTFEVYAGAASCGTGTPTRLGPVAVIDTGTAGDGIGTAELTMATPSEQTYCIVARLTGGGQTSTNGYYDATPSEVAVLTVVSTTGKFATGGGWIVDPGTGGHGNFGFTARFTKPGTPKGQAVYVWRGQYGGVVADFVVKSNSMTGLSFADLLGNGTFPWRAVLDGKATIRISRASNGEQLYADGNATFRVVVVDSGQSSGQGVDSYAIRVLDKDGVPFKVVGAWSGPTNTGGVLLSGGNAVVHLK